MLYSFQLNEVGAEVFYLTFSEDTFIMNEYGAPLIEQITIQFCAVSIFWSQDLL